MGLETLGGERNQHYARKDTMEQYEDGENRLGFQELREKFAKQAVKIFSNTEEGLMKSLREHALFQRLKEEQRFQEVESFELLAAQFPEIEDDYDLEDSRQQAALLSMIAQLDYLQDDEMLQQAA